MVKGSEVIPGTSYRFGSCFDNEKSFSFNTSLAKTNAKNPEDYEEQNKANKSCYVIIERRKDSMVVEDYLPVRKEISNAKAREIHIVLSNIM